MTTEAFYAKAYSTDYLAGVPDIVADKVFGILRQWSIRLEGTALRDCPKERKELTDMLCQLYDDMVNRYRNYITKTEGL